MDLIKRFLAAFYLPRFTHEKLGENIIPHVCANCGAGWWGRYEDNVSTKMPPWCKCSEGK